MAFQREFYVVRRHRKNMHPVWPGKSIHSVQLKRFFHFKETVYDVEKYLWMNPFVFLICTFHQICVSVVSSVQNLQMCINKSSNPGTGLSGTHLSRGPTVVFLAALAALYLTLVSESLTATLEFLHKD